MTAPPKKEDAEPASPLRLWSNFAPLRENFEPVRDVGHAAGSENQLNPFAGLDAGPWLTWGAIVGCWTLIALLSASQSYLLFTDRGDEVSLGDIAVWAATEILTWAALSPIILWLARRIRIRRRSWQRALLSQALLGVIFAFVEPAMQIVVGAVLFDATVRGRGLVEMYVFSCVRKFHINVLLYWMIVGLSHAIEYYRRYRDRELRASQLEARLVQSRLEALKMQLHPHFLFNALNSISALIDEDPRVASRMVARVGEFLRIALESSATPRVAFAEELRFVRTYLDIEQIRFEDRLRVTYDIEPEATSALVPSLLLQPIVENAIKHGIAQCESEGRIEIRARTRASRLHIEVCDNGPGFAREWLDHSPHNGGVGVANTRARLGNLYESDYSFELANAPHGGAVVRFELPFVDHEE